RQDEPPLYWAPDAPDDDFDGAVPDPAMVDEAFTTWRHQVAQADEWLDGLDDDNLGDTVPHRDGTVSVRDVLVHLIEEYARHAGHADLLRECIDGRTGQ
ncbi:MAG: hypothetical protein B7X41_09975, partial [Microbacterium sp. 14-71-5]